MLKLQSITTLLAVLMAAGLFVVSAPTAQATVHAFTVTGTVDFLDVPPDYIPSDEPFVGGETFTLTFDFDDSTAQSSTNGTTVSSFAGAISNVSFSFSNGLSASATATDVLEADNGSNHQWSFSLFTGSPGFTTDLPDPLVATNDISGMDEDFGLQSVNLVLLDLQAGAYSQSPPELVLPTSAVFEDAFVDVTWESFDSPGAFISAVTTVSSVSSTPIGGAVPVLTAPGLGLLLFGLGGTGATLLRRHAR